MGVVISPNLVLSPATPVGDAPNADNPLIGWHNLTTISGVSADSSDALFPVSNLANPMTHRLWKSISLAPQDIVVDTGFVDPIDYVAIAGHNFGSGGIAVSVEGDATPLIAPFIPANDVPLLFRFTPQSYAQVTIHLEPNSVAPLASVLYVGKLLVLQRRIYVGHRPLVFNEAVEHAIGLSDRGQFLGSLVLSAWNSGRINQENVTPGFYRSEVEPWRRNSLMKRQPFFFAWRPGDYPDEVAYCWATNSMEVENQRPNGMMRFTLDVQGIVS